VSHPSLGLPAVDVSAGYPAAADRIRAASDRLGARALEVAVERDPTFRDRYDELGLRHLLRDTEVMIDRIALSVASNDPGFLVKWIDQTVPVYRRRHVSSDDVARVLEGLRASVGAVLVGDEAAPMHAAIDEALTILRWNRRIAGDARKRNRFLQFLYRGA
jgi:hypothetical protein